MVPGRWRRARSRSVVRFDGQLFNRLPSEGKMLRYLGPQMWILTAFDFLADELEEGEYCARTLEGPCQPLSLNDPHIFARVLRTDVFVLDRQKAMRLGRTLLDGEWTDIAIVRHRISRKVSHLDQGRGQLLLAKSVSAGPAQRPPSASFLSRSHSERSLGAGGPIRAIARWSLPYGSSRN